VGAGNGSRVPTGSDRVCPSDSCFFSLRSRDPGWGRRRLCWGGSGMAMERLHGVGRLAPGGCLRVRSLLTGRVWGESRPRRGGCCTQKVPIGGGWTCCGSEGACLRVGNQPPLHCRLRGQLLGVWRLETELERSCDVGFVGSSLWERQCPVSAATPRGKLLRSPRMRGRLRKVGHVADTPRGAYGRQASGSEGSEG